MITWLIEFFNGIMIATLLILIHTNKTNMWIALVHLAFEFVIIPFIYLLNNEVSKAIILAENWWNGIISVRNLEKERQRIFPSNPNGVGNRSLPKLPVRKTSPHMGAAKRENNVPTYNNWTAE